MEAFSDLGFVADSGPDGFEEIGFIAEEAPGKGIGKKIGRGALAALHGLAKGAESLGGQREVREAERALRGEPLAAPFFQPKSALEKGISRASEAALTTAGLGGGAKIAALAGTGGLLGQAVEEIGGGPGTQLVAELAPLFLSPVAAAKILPSAEQKSLVEGARRLGMGEKELAPLLRGKGANKFAKSFLAKQGTREKIVSRSQKGVDRALQKANRQVAELGQFPENLRTELIESFEDLAVKAEGQIGTTARDTKGTRFLRKELGKIGRKELTGNDLKNLYRSINKEFGGSPPPAVRDAKEVIVDLIGKASPEAAQDFRLTNELYTRLKAIEGGPSRGSEYLDRAELWGLVSGVAAGHPVGALESFASSEALRRAFTHAVSGPRGQRLTAKMLKALSDGKPAVAQAAARRLLNEVEKGAPLDQGDEEGPVYQKRQAAGLGLFSQ